MKVILHQRRSLFCFFLWHEPLSQAKSKVHLIKYMSIQLKCTLTQNVHLSAYCTVDVNLPNILRLLGRSN